MSQPPGNWQSNVTLRDGTPVALRPIHPRDAPLLRALHGRLSAESRYFRFFSARTDLPIEEAEQLATVDYHTRMAFVALPLQDGEPSIIGVARYGVADPSKPDQADAAIVVQDSYQGRGLGTVLLARLLEYAHEHGIQYFVANVDSMNTTMLKLIQRANLPTEMKLESGVWDIRVRITDALNKPN